MSDDTPLRPWKATHRLRLITIDGVHVHVDVMLDRLEPGEPYGPAYTDVEWRMDSECTWELTADGWTCMGHTVLSAPGDAFPWGRPCVSLAVLSLAVLSL